MKIFRSIGQMREFSRRSAIKGKSIGLVPTMGALHEGHLSLIRRARRENDLVVVSIFVNPKQFGMREDFKKYPRQLRRDSALCRKEGAEIVFYPRAEEMYPSGYRTYVEVNGLSDLLCGEFRPEHFRGVATVVAKLFNIIGPTRAYFGQKDAQQSVIIKRLAADLNIPVKIQVLPTVRYKDGLALSSRNAYLSRQERQDALVLSQALSLARRLAREGRRPPEIIRRMKELIQGKAPAAKIQYIAIVDMEGLRPVEEIKGKALAALAVWIGNTRLIDNILISKE